MKGLPARLKQPARRWIRSVFVASALGLLGCSSATDPGPVTLLPGATLPLDTTVTIDVTGVTSVMYDLDPGAFADVTVR